MVGFLMVKPTPVPRPGRPEQPEPPAHRCRPSRNRSAGRLQNADAQAGELDKKHSYQEELALLDKAIKVDPNRWEAYDLKAQIYLTTSSSGRKPRTISRHRWRAAAMRRFTSSTITAAGILLRSAADGCT